MSTFENNRYAYSVLNATMPQWTRAERYEYCESASSRVIKTGKGKRTRRGVLMAVLTGIR